MDNPPSETSQQTVPALPEWAGEEIFRFMEDRYGAKWIDSLGGIPRERVKRAWREDLIGYTPGEIKRGLNACRSRTWPPTLPEFLLLCKPLNDPRADWAEACEQMALRLRDGSDIWSRPQVYWAAVAIGAHDLHTLAYDQCKARWQRALDNAKSAPIPPVLAALPEPGEQSVPREEARRRTAELAQKVAAIDGKQPGKQWAVDLLRREAASAKDVPNVAIGAWRQALGFDDHISPADALAKLEKAA